MNILIKLINEVKALCNTVITTVNAIKVKTDSITSNLFTATHASRIDATISSRQADAGLTTTHASRIDSAISTRASQTTVDAIKAKTDLITAGIGGIKNVQRGVLNTGSSTGIAVPISSVNMSKSFLNFSSRSLSPGTTFTPTHFSATGSITSPTAITFTHGAPASSGHFIEWQVIEFY